MSRLQWSHCILRCFSFFTLLLAAQYIILHQVYDTSTKNTNALRDCVGVHETAGSIPVTERLTNDCQQMQPLKVALHHIRKDQRNLKVRVRPSWNFSNGSYFIYRFSFNTKFNQNTTFVCLSVVREMKTKTITQPQCLQRGMNFRGRKQAERNWYWYKPQT